jgi:hypothetical protein
VKNLTSKNLAKKFDKILAQIKPEDIENIFVKLQIQGTNKIFDEGKDKEGEKILETSVNFFLDHHQEYRFYLIRGLARSAIYRLMVLTEKYNQLIEYHKKTLKEIEDATINLFNEGHDKHDFHTKIMEYIHIRTIYKNFKDFKETGDQFYLENAIKNVEMKRETCLKDIKLEYFDEWYQQIKKNDKETDNDSDKYFNIYLNHLKEEIYESKGKKISKPINS